jgi:ERCC4-type nuclease
MVSKLASGDINVILDNGSILAIERKEIHDFLGSIGDGRIFKQVEMMASSAKYSVVVIEGSLQINYDTDMVIANGELTNWKGSSVRAALFAIQFSGCPIMFCPKGTYAQQIEELVKIVSKDDEHLQRIHRRIVTFPPISTAQDILMAFPGIGFKRAESMIKFCGENGSDGKLADMLCWATALQLIPYESRPVGWGNAVVRNFKETMGLQENEYLDKKKEETT